jgi:hypothetical protein
MRQFQETYLFRATVVDEKSYNQKRRTFYLIAAHKKEAEENAKRQLNSGETLTTMSLLGKQSGDYFFK